MERPSASRWFPVTHFVTLTFGKATSEQVALQKIRERHDSQEWLNRAAIGILSCLEDDPELHAHCILVGTLNLNRAGEAALWRQSAEPLIMKERFAFAGRRCMIQPP